MHKYRSKARQSAWYEKEGDPKTFNPFGRFRSQSTSLGDVEENASIHSEPHAPSPGDVRRMNLQQEQLPHPGTFPRSSREDRPSFDIEKVSPTNQSRGLEASTDSEGTVADRQIESPELVASSTPEEKKGARQRILSKFGKHKKQDGLDGTEVDRVESSKSTKRKKQKFTFMGQIRATILSSPINLLLFAVPVGILANYLHLKPVIVFVINFIAIIPLAAMLSYATEEIALRVGETLGGLLNASFGNAVELIVSILALVKDEVLIVQTSLIGSILSNLLLVMGMCFFFGGLNRVEQHFNVVVAQTASSLLALAVGALLIPTAFHAFATTSSNGGATETAAAGDQGVEQISRGTSIILLLVYGCYLFFQLKSHAHIYNAPSEKSAPRRKEKGAIGKGLVNMGNMSANATAPNPGKDNIKNPDKDDDAEEPQLSMLTALLTLGISTTLVALCAEFMVGSIDSITQSGPIKKTFVGLILLPIVGNAAEHATAVTVAIKDKMDLAIGVAVGSSMQIALLVIPFVVILGWIIGKDDMTLNFDPFQIIVLFVAILLVNYLITDGKSHWLEGVLLMAAYTIIAIAAWFHP